MATVSPKLLTLPATVPGRRSDVGLVFDVLIGRGSPTGPGGAATGLLTLSDDDDYVAVTGIGGWSDSDSCATDDFWPGRSVDGRC
jgi:hypothetical protein